MCKSLERRAKMVLHFISIAKVFKETNSLIQFKNKSNKFSCLIIHEVD